MSEANDTATPEPADKPTVTTERWVCAGTRIGKNGKKVTEWIDPGGVRLRYPYESLTPGSVYEVRVDRTSERTTMYGDARYVGRCEDDALREQVIMEHRGAMLEIGMAAQQKRDRADDPLTAAVDEVARLLRLVPPPQRGHAINYAYHTIARKAW